MYRKYGKRYFDLIISLMGILVLSPLLVLLVILIRIKLGSPVIFRQNRPGLNEKIFTMYKFRTMTNQKDKEGKLLSDAERLTPFGKKLRSTSLDELPELFNIIKGEMSLVGPRPLLTEYLPLYNEHQKRRHEVRPGLTGLAQISGRNAITWEEKFDLDVKYIDNMSFGEDLRIIVATFKKVFFREGITSETSVTVEPFRGTKSE